MLDFKRANKGVRFGQIGGELGMQAAGELGLDFNIGRCVLCNGWQPLKIVGLGQGVVTDDDVGEDAHRPGAQLVGGMQVEGASLRGFQTQAPNLIVFGMICRTLAVGCQDKCLRSVSVDCHLIHTSILPMNAA